MQNSIIDSQVLTTTTYAHNGPDLDLSSIDGQNIIYSDIASSQEKVLTGSYYRSRQGTYPYKENGITATKALENKKYPLQSDIKTGGV